ncbi:MAG: phosphatidate cytidylyltransferase [Candidatus Schekmanbacteria bacterium]|nr:phosphatidate cytidylyltransferase [Candidatus Schekmanbacteria bacterium]
MHSKRILTALIFIPLFILLVLKGGFLPFWLLVTVAALIGLQEFYALWAEKIAQPYKILGLLSGLILCWSMGWADNSGLHLVLSGSILVILWRCLRRAQAGEKDLSPQLALEAAGTFLGLFYVVWLLGHFIWLRRLSQGREAVFLVCLINASCDTLAYYVGSTIGRRRLAVKISPKKSIEGAIGGWLGSILMAYLAGLCFYPLPVYHLIALGAILGLAAQTGDLIESLFKRIAQIKDSGRIIPGHGGMLDRVDSLLFSAPIAYYYLKLFNL